MDARNVVIGAAIGYREPQVAPFVASLSRSGYRGALVLIVDARLGRSLRDHPGYRHCHIAVAPPGIVGYLASGHSRRNWRLWRAVHVALRAYVRATSILPVGATTRMNLRLAVAQHCYQPSETRYMHAYRILRDGPYERVLLSDVRDVLFQSDPFAQLPERGLAVGMETRRLTMATEAFNAGQVKRAYGEGVLRMLGERPISCCGVTYGDRASILRYLELMIEEILALDFRAARFPMDQALHNYILWTGKFGDFSQLDTLGSPIATLAMLDRAEVRQGPDGRILNRDGSVPGIVHQYDRWPDLAPGLQALLAGPGS